MGRFTSGGSVIQAASSASLPSGSALSPQDGGKEGYPCFMMLGGDMNSYHHAKVYNSEFVVISDAWADANHTTNNYIYGLRADPMFAYNSDFGTLHSQLTSQDWTSEPQYTQSVYNTDQYPFSYMINSTPRGYWKADSLHSSEGNFFAGYKKISVVMTEGRRPRRVFCTEGRYFYEAAFQGNFMRTHARYEIDIDTLISASLGTTSHGSACYNMRTKKLAVVSKTSSYNALFVIISSDKCLFDDGPEEFFANALVEKEFTNSSNIQQYRNADSDHARVILGDNDYIALHYKYSNSYYYTVVDPNGDIAIQDEVATTTSYGFAQGSYYNTRIQSTWDHEWAFGFIPYYYYGCGMAGVTHSTRDPRIHFSLLNTANSGGGFVYPKGRSGFFFSVGDNHDSKGLTTGIWDFSNTDVSGTPYSPTAEYEIARGQTAVSAYTPGTNITPSNNQSAMTGYYYSTNYPRFTGCTYWPNQDSSMSYAGEI